MIEGHAERHDRTRDDPSVLDHGPLLDLTDEDDERRAAERHERRIRVREAERPDVGHHRAAELVLHDPEARQVEVQVVHEVAYEAEEGAEEAKRQTVEDGLRPFHLAVASLSQPRDALLHLARDLGHVLLVDARDLDAREVAAALDRHLEEDVDRVAEHDAATGHDAVQLRVLPNG